MGALTIADSAAMILGLQDEIRRSEVTRNMTIGFTESFWWPKEDMSGSGEAIGGCSAVGGVLGAGF